MGVRTERQDDQAAVRALHLAAFGDHGLVVADLVDALRVTISADSGLSLVAVDTHGDVLGHAMFTPSLLDAPQRLVEVQVLSPVAVQPPRQGQGIGSALIEAGLQVMTERSVPVVFLEGDPGYYSRFGFAAGAGQGFRSPSLRIPDAAFQAVRLPHHQPWMTGTLVYSETFWRHDAVGLRDSGAGRASSRPTTGGPTGADGMTPYVRPARPGDLEVLVRLRLENGRVHGLLDPTVYRVPGADEARRHFSGRLADDDPRSTALVAVVDDAVLGSVEVAFDEDPPAHQVLQPVPSAHVHLVVAESARALGIGTVLLEAAEVWAAERGVRHLVAGISADNQPALRFYGTRGYRDSAVVWVKDLPEPPRGA